MEGPERTDRAEVDEAWPGSALRQTRRIGSDQTWIARNDKAEMRLVDLVTGPGRQITASPRDEARRRSGMRWDELDHETLHEIVDQVKWSSAERGFPLWASSGPATAVPER